MARPEGEERIITALHDNWGWLLGLGVLFIVLGTIGMGMLFALTMTSVLFFGMLLLIGGGAQLFEAFKCSGWKSVLWHVLMAVLYVVAGVTVIGDPAAASLFFTLILAGTIIGVGVVRLVIAFQHKGESGWIWALLSGVVSLVLGAMILAKWPVSGLWVIGLFVAIELLVNGWSYVMLALAARSAKPAATSSAAPA